MGTEIIVRKTEEYKEDPETIRIWKSIMADRESYRKYWGIGQAE